MTCYFLLLDAALLLIPFLLLLDSRYFKWKNLWICFPAVIPAMVLYSETGVFFATLKIWQFNDAYNSGIYYRNLPLEQYLFYLAFNVVCLALYQYIAARAPKKTFDFSFFISNLLLGISVAVLFAASSRWYTLLSVSALFILLLLVEYKAKLRFMGVFYRALLYVLPLFLAVQALLSNLPFVSYRWDDTMNAGIFGIPFENLFLYTGSYLLSVFVLEWIKSRRPQHG